MNSSKRIRTIWRLFHQATTQAAPPNRAPNLKPSHLKCIIGVTCIASAVAYIKYMAAMPKSVFVAYHHVRHNIIQLIGLETEQWHRQSCTQLKYPSLRVYADAVPGNWFLIFASFQKTYASFRFSEDKESLSRTVQHENTN